MELLHRHLLQILKNAPIVADQLVSGRIGYGFQKLEHRQEVSVALGARVSYRLSRLDGRWKTDVSKTLTV